MGKSTHAGYRSPRYVRLAPDPFPIALRLPNPKPQVLIADEGDVYCHHLTTRRTVQGDGTPPSMDAITCSECSYIMLVRDDPNFDWPAWRQRQAREFDG